MTHAFDDLVEAVRSGQSDAFARLVAGVRAAAEGDPGALSAAAVSPEAILRRAVAWVLPQLPSANLEQIAAALAHDSATEVRRTLAESLARGLVNQFDEVVAQLLIDDAAEVRSWAVQAARLRPALEALLVTRLSRDDNDLIRQTIARALAGAAHHSVLPGLIAAYADEDNRTVAEACAVSIEAHMELGGYPDALPRPRLPVLENAQQRLGLHGPERFPRFVAWLAHRVAHDCDPDRLRAFGSILTEEAATGRLPRAHGVAATCAVIRQALSGAPPRAVVLLGEPGSGKTAIVNELVHQLRGDSPEPWQVIRVSPADLLAGTAFLGEWQTKLRNLVQTVRFPRRVVLYVPNLEELSGAGRGSHNDTSIATALAPHIERGEVVILGETTPEAFRTGLGAIGSLRRLFHTVEIRETNPRQTRAVLQAVRDEAGASVHDNVLDRLGELADFYLPGIAQPGRSVGLLRRLLGDRASQATDAPRPITERDVLHTLSTSTGIPIDFLDDSVPLDRAQIRAFFEARVMGQPEAVGAVVDLVALIKSGLSDPAKPFGVLFFVGPTGVGKTEMARTLAELLFGDPGRMLRIDMSEFATYEAHERLLGWGTTPGLLTAPVRERPFSVVLLDEIEKAHPTVFDLCLQIFDAGRLTDRQGRTTDFRRTIIILTSNLGSRSGEEGPFGFQAEPARPSETAPDLRELDRCFRPEFLNRIDRIVTFRPLEAETAEKIARREVARVLERSGIARRRLTVDVDPGVIGRLLREGYSATFGARPLKRTVERLVLQPVAWAIAAGSVSAGSVLRLVTRGGQVEVEIAPPEHEGDGAVEPPKPPRTGHRAAPATPVASRVSALSEQVARLREDAQRLSERKSELIDQTAGPSFREDRSRASIVQDEIFRLEGVLMALGSLERGVRDVAEHSKQRRLSERDATQIRRRLDLLETQGQHVDFLVHCPNSADLADAYLCLTRTAPNQGTGLGAVGKMALMYKGLAIRRGLEVTVLDDHQGGNPFEDSITLQLTGAGAYGLLANEAGLHHFLQKRAPGRKSLERDVVRVEVLRVPADDVSFPPADLRIEATLLRDAPGRLLGRPKLEVQLLHLPAMISVRAWTDVSRAEAIERLRPLLRARVESEREAPIGTTMPTPPVIRRYVLGPSTYVKDLRVGKTTGRLDLVLKGYLDPFLKSAESGQSK